MKILKPPEDTSTVRKLQSKVRSTFLGVVTEALDENKDSDSDEDTADVRDVVDELSLTAEPILEDMGDPELIALQRAGKLDLDDEDAIHMFKRHKARSGKALFEAENANNLGIEHYSFGELDAAMAYFKRAQELVSKDRKPAAQELEDFKNFLRTKYHSNLQSFFVDLSDGEWRLALSRKRFVSAMSRLHYDGDANRLFEMMDFGGDGDGGKSDGKVTIAELTSIFKVKGNRLSEMDFELIEKAIALSNMGAVLVLRGEAMAALQRFREAGRILQQRRDSENDFKVHRNLFNIAVAYIHLENYDTALHFISSVLEKQEASQGILCQDVMNSLYLCGFCFLLKANRFHIVYDRKRMDKFKQNNPVEINYNLAQCAFKERLRRQQEALRMQLENEDRDGGVDNIQVTSLRLQASRSCEIIAEIQGKIGQHERAHAQLRMAVEQKELALNEPDPELLNAWNSLISSCMRCKRYEEALDLLERALPSTEAIFGVDSVSAATQRFHVGLLNFKIGVAKSRLDKEQAADCFERAIFGLKEVRDMQVDQLGEEHEEVAATEHLLGTLHMAVGEPTEARRNFENALFIRMQIYGTSHVSVASSAHALGALYARKPRRQEEAFQLLRRAAVIREEQLGPESRYLADSMHEVGSVLLLRRTQKDHEEALRFLARAAQIRERTVGKESVQYASSMHQIGQAHVQLGLYNEAKSYLEVALALRQRHTPRKSAQIALTSFTLGVAHLHLQSYSSAMKFLKAAYTIRETMFGKSHPQSADSLHQIGVVHVRRNELKSALPFLQISLELRRQINALDAQNRLEDSDEDPRDIEDRESTREKRIRLKKEARKKALAQEDRRRAVIEKRLAEEQRRESKRAEAERQKLENASQQDAWGRGSSFVRRSSWLSDGGADSARGKSQARSSCSSSPTDAETSVRGRSSPRGDGSPGSPHSGSPRSSRSPRSGDVSGSQGEQPVQPGDDDVGEESNDSEIDAKTMGVNPKGFLTSKVAHSMEALGIVYMELEDFKESKDFLLRSICLFEEVYGQISPEFAGNVHTLGVLYKRQHAHIRALRYFRQALHLREKACGHEHESTAQSCIELGLALNQLDQPDEGNIYFLRAVNIREKLYGPKDPKVLGLREAWSKMVADQMQHDPVKTGEAMPHFARRSPESFLHGFASRVDQAPVEEARMDQEAVAKGTT